MRLRLVKLQELDEKAQKIRAIAELAEDYKNIDEVLYDQGLLFMPEII